MLTNTQTQSAGAPRQPKKDMSPTISVALDANLELLNLKEVSGILRLAPITIHRLVARQLLPAYKMCHRILFKKQDVLEYFERSKCNNPQDYGKL